jgi:hypothetical protein
MFYFSKKKKIKIIIYFTFKEHYKDVYFFLIRNLSSIIGLKLYSLSDEYMLNTKKPALQK